jgi:hypothetical protein
MMQQMKLPFGSTDAEDRAAIEAIHSRLNALELVAKHCRIEWDETTGRVMKALGKLCGSKLQISRGVVGLRWVGTTEDLAEDRDVDRAKKTVGAALLRLQRLGVIRKENHLDWRGKPDGLIITLEMARINQLARIGTTSQKDVREDPLKDVREEVLEDVLKDVPRLAATLYTDLPSIPKNPPPTEESQPEIQVAEPSGSVVAERSNRSAADFGIESDSLRDLRNAFASIGLERYRPLAEEFFQRADEAITAIATYRAQQSKFDRPGAVVSFLRSGAWPVPGVRTLEEIETSKRKSDARSREAAIERRRIEIAKRERNGFTEDERAQLATIGITI